MTEHRRDLSHIREAVAAVAEHVFSAVLVLRTEALAVYEETASRGERLSSRDVRSLGPRIQELLQQHTDIITGLGVIVAPDLLVDEQHLLEWWQTEQGRTAPVALVVDLNPASLGFYDYAAAEWFDVPRRSGDRHIVGPYVDVHGTGRYVLTFTIPLMAGGEFLGVVGADVPVAWFESRLLGDLGHDRAVVVLNAERRVVLSTSSRFLVGGLVPAGLSGPADQPLEAFDVPNLPWQVAIDG
jgi:hypothetical protein